MDIGRIRVAEYQIGHRHKDGAWGEMVEQPQHHDATEHDPERRWLRGKLFKCTSCDEWAVIVPTDQNGVPEQD